MPNYVSSHRRLSRLLQSLGVVSFFVLLSLPLVQMIWRPFTHSVDLARKTEYRRRAELPKVTLAGLTDLPGQFDKYFQDHFGFRDPLILGYHSVKYHLFGESPSNRVVIGKDGWLFGGGATEDLDYFTEEELSQIKEVLETRAQYLEARGITYVFLVIPSKRYVYSEYYPEERKKRDLLNRSSQFLEYMQKNSKVRVVYPLEDLIKAKRSEQVILYRKTDGHWTQPGAFVGYQALIRELQSTFPSIEPLQRSEYKVAFKHEEGALGRMLGVLSPPMARKPIFRPLKRDPWFRHSKRTKFERGVGIRYVDRSVELKGAVPSNEPLIRKALVYRDSFFTSIYPFFSKHFIRSSVLSSHIYGFDPLYIEIEKPDVVVDQVLDTYLSPNLPGFHKLTRELLNDPDVSKVGEVLYNFWLEGESLKTFGGMTVEYGSTSGLRLRAGERRSGFTIPMKALRVDQKKSSGRYGLFLSGIVEQGSNLVGIETRKKNARGKRVTLAHVDIGSNHEVSVLIPIDSLRGISHLEVVLEGEGSLAIRELSLKGMTDVGISRYNP